MNNESLTKIKQAISMVEDKEVFYATLISKLKLIEVDDSMSQTCGTDGEMLMYNPKFTDTVRMDELAGVMLHEVLHCAQLHLWRRDERDPTLWNFATDLAINTIVNEVFPLPKGCLLDTKYTGMSAEDIYDTFPKPKKKKSKSGKGNGKGGGRGKLKQQSWGDHSMWGKSIKDQKNKNGKGKGILDKLFGKTSKPHKGKSEREKEEKWQSVVDNEILSHYGTLPEALKRVIQKSYYIPVVDWSSLVANILSEDTTDYTMSRPDRRFLDDEFMLPDLYSVEVLKDVVFAYDTSGSVNEEDLKSFFHETKSIMENFPNLKGWLAVCDADLHSFVEIEYQNSYEDFRFYGGGGTNFEPVFREIKDRDIKPKAVFYFTDTEGYFPNEHPEYPVFWLVPTRVSRYQSHISVPFGTVVKYLPKI